MFTVVRISCRERSIEARLMQSALSSERRGRQRACLLWTIGAGGGYLWSKHM